jgi:hypothetical protein
VADFAPSVSTSLFLESAESLTVRLEANGSERARDMAREARALAARFRLWQTVAPARNERVESIQLLFDLNRRALDFLAGGGR